MTTDQDAPAHLAVAIGDDADKQAELIAATLPFDRQRASGFAIDDEGSVGITAIGTGMAPAADGFAWAQRPLSPSAATLASRRRTEDDAAILQPADDGTIELRTGVSGVQGLYIHLDDSGDAGQVATTPSAMVEAGLAAPTPDWDAWAQIIATGGALGARTPFLEVRRLQPHEALVAGPGRGVRVERRSWDWVDTMADLPARRADDDAIANIAQALDATVARHAELGPLRTLLSGGWDSRVLTLLAANHDPTVSTWTTSKDEGTAREELLARRVARLLKVPHHVIFPDALGFADDLRRYADRVDHGAPFHVWLMALTDALAEGSGTVMDGLGGGVFFGGAFPPTHTVRQDSHHRFRQLIRYVRSSAGVIRSEVEAQLTERTQAGFDELCAPLDGHREADALTAYLTRTLPGISLGPHALIASVAPVATPFLDHQVVLASTRISPSERRARRLYPQLLRRWSSELAELPTVREPPPRLRMRPRRSTSRHTAAAFRAALADHPVGELLEPRLRDADVETWQARLRSHADQHLLRSLWLFALWADRHQIDLHGLGTLTEPTG